MGPLLTVSEYAIQCIHKLQYENLHSFTPRQSVTDAFNAHAQEWVKHTVWKEDCRAWYRDNDTGRVNAVWPGSSLHYQHTIAKVRWEDMEIRYKGAKGMESGGGFGGNMWAFLGMGWSYESRVNGAVLAESAKLQEDAKAKAEQGKTSEGGSGEADRKELQAQLKAVEARKEDVSPYLDSGMVDWR